MDLTPFSIPFAETTPFGELVAVHLPPGLDDEVPAEVLGGLFPEERAIAEEARRRRRIEWCGGRLALRLATERLGVAPGPVLRGERGEPLLPEGLTASVSHKRRIAAALVARAGQGTVGLDLEELEPARMSIAPRVLRPEEEEEVFALPEDRRWRSLATRFAVKEAVYKALHPHVRRYVRFSEASVRLEPGAEPEVSLHLEGGEGPFRLEARAEARAGHLIASVRISSPSR
ncbi:MAG TPA: 4'-phosphopantetheinyl transferase superfamily protein [Vulgatibacter sp.]|nr:4'-phosphopantetheinyl transferase superfamily protein [Vulgatibacter sp.]